MYAVFEICTPVFGLGMLGYLATRFGWFSTQAADGLARFVFDWAVPFLLVRVFSTQVLPPEFPWRLLLSFYLPVLLMYGLALSMASLVFNLEPRIRVIAALGSTFGNSVLLGLPLMLLAALPSGINVYLFAERYGAGQRLATTTIFISTVVSLFGLAAVLMWAGSVVE